MYTRSSSTNLVSIEPRRAAGWASTAGDGAPQGMAAGAQRTTLLREAKQLRQMAATIRASADGRSMQAEVGCERNRPAQLPAQRSASERGGFVGICVDELESQSKPRRVRPPFKAAHRAVEPVRLLIGVLEVEVASEADTTARVALVSRHDCASTLSQWHQVAVGDWLVLQQRTKGDLPPHTDHDLLVELRSGSASDCSHQRGTLDRSSIGSVVVDCSAVSSGQGSIDSWFQLSDDRGNAAAQVLLAVEQHVSAAVPRRVTSLPPGWGKTPVVDVAERVREVSKCIQRRKRRQSAACTARLAAVQSTRPVEGPETSPESRDGDQDCNEEDTVGVNKTCLGTQALQRRSAQDRPNARDAGHRSKPTATRGPLTQQRPPRDTVKRAPTSSGAVRAAATTVVAPSSTPRHRRKREFALLNALL